MWDLPPDQADDEDGGVAVGGWRGFVEALYGAVAAVLSTRLLGTAVVESESVDRHVLHENHTKITLVGINRHPALSRTYIRPRRDIPMPGSVSIAELYGRGVQDHPGGGIVRGRWFSRRGADRRFHIGRVACVDGAGRAATLCITYGDELPPEITTVAALLAERRGRAVRVGDVRHYPAVGTGAAPGQALPGGFLRPLPRPRQIG